MFPAELYHAIASFSGEWTVIQVLKHHMTPLQHSLFYLPHRKKTLIYGEVQSGKTARLIQAIKASTLPCILVIQNSLLLQAQYMARCREEGLDVQCVSRDTKQITKRVVVLMNNVHQLNRYHALPTAFTEYDLFLDESDLTYKRERLCRNATTETHITATPFVKPYRGYFDVIIPLPPPPTYRGLTQIDAKLFSGFKQLLRDLVTVPTGLLLLNHLNLVTDMTKCAEILSRQYPSIPIVLLTVTKSIYRGGVKTRTRCASISKIIDRLGSGPCIVIANRMSSRGISFTSSDYSRHVTHQMIMSPTSMTSFLQKCRIFGVYAPGTKTTLYVHQEKDLAFIEKVRNVLRNKQTLLKPLLAPCSYVSLL